MDLKVDEFIDSLLSQEALELPSDSVEPGELSLELPEWFDEEKFNKGRRFFWDFGYGFFSSMLFGVIPVLSIPSILRVLVATQRSSTKYTAYKRYAATGLHLFTWFENELKPGSPSWRSIYMVRSLHLRAGSAGKSKGYGVVSQRDLALTQFGFIGYSVLKPDKFGIRQLREGDWDAFNHVWRVLGYMMGLEDRFNICRKTMDETHLVCEILQEKVFSPSMENVPEYFEHMSRAFLDGMGTVVPGANAHAGLYFCRELADVPGFIYTETDRIKLRKQLKKKLEGRSLSTGVQSSSLVLTPIDDVPTSSRFLYYDDYETFESNPVYKQLPKSSKIHLHVNAFLFYLNSIYLFRILLNVFFRLVVFALKYFPFGAFFSFGYKASFVNIFAESPATYSELRTNSEYYEEDKRLYQR